MAKPNRYTVAQVREALCEAGGLRTIAAAKLGCCLKTVDNYIARYPEVAEEARHQRERTLDLAEAKLFKAIHNGEAWAICFFLKCQGKGRHYSERHEIVGSDGAPMVFTLRFDGNSDAN